MTITAKILTDSISPAGHRLTTFEVCFPRIVLAEFNTHRVFSRNSASSRAIPVKKMLERVRTEPFVPEYWGKNQKGMQAVEQISPKDFDDAVFTWRECRNHSMNAAAHLALPAEEGGLDIHKQTANRLLEPWLFHTVIVSATEWSNFFNLRDNNKAAPEIQRPAALMHELYLASKPKELKANQLDWHLPLTDGAEIGGDARPAGPCSKMSEKDFWKRWAKISTGRCARVSVLTHDGKRNLEEDIRMHDDLLNAGHMSPFEHPARPMTDWELAAFSRKEMVWHEKDEMWRETGKTTHFLGNYNGWVQHRKLIPGEWDIHTYRGTQA